MTKIHIPHDAIVFVGDGCKALFLRNDGDEKFPNFRTERVFLDHNPPTHEQGSDKPGRSFSSVGHGRSAVEQTDWHEESERAFLKTLAERLTVAVTTGETSALTMVAPPRALGMIRADYSPAVRKALHGEVDKDLVKLPVYEIEKQLLA